MGRAFTHAGRRIVALVVTIALAGAVVAWIWPRILP